MNPPHGLLSSNGGSFDVSNTIFLVRSFVRLLSVGGRKGRKMKTTETEEELGFPVKPYDIQIRFARELIGTIDRGMIGVFESPTGTGKSLSIICGSLSWISAADGSRSEPPKAAAVVQGKPEEEKIEQEDDWIAATAKKREEERIKDDERMRMQRRNELRKKLHEMKETESKDRWEAAPSAKRKKDVGDEEEEEEEEEVDFCLGDYRSDDDDDDEGSIRTKSQKDEDEEGEGGKNSDDEDFDELKVLYSSRTHSQLSQFIGEFKRTRWSEDLTMVCLASRKQLCVNEAVNVAGRSAATITERCLDLIEKSGCKFCTDRQLQQSFRNNVLSHPRDIEELVDLGKKLGCCPYYGTRRAIKYAQLVILPYQMLLHKPTRESLGVRLQGNVVIADEAHNIVEAINDVHSTEVSLDQIETSLGQLTAYRDRFLSMLNPKNLVRVKQLVNLVEGLRGSLARATPATPDSVVMSTNEFVFHAKIDSFDLFKIVRFCEKSKIAFKVNGFSESKARQQARARRRGQAEEGNAAEPLVRHRPPVLQLVAFLESLSNPDSDGRVLVRRPAQGEPEREATPVGLRYLLLNPERHFRDVVKESRSVILAGGTLEPLPALLRQLFDETELGRIHRFSCGHVIPPENLLVLTLCEGPSKVAFDFTFQSRSSPTLVDDLGRALANLSNVVPDGIVCFFPSYAYLEAVLSRWSTTGMLATIDRKKKLFKEPRESEHVSRALDQFRTFIDSTFPGSPISGTATGAMLLCVVGGKMSEGINFADGLGRCVVVIGMPYPNINDPVLKEKLKHSGEATFYDDMCMKAVNQSIGRAIRHANDFAIVVLADRRFARPSTREKLPRWMADRLPSPVPETFSSTFSSAARFFTSKKTTQAAIEETRRGGIPATPKKIEMK